MVLHRITLSALLVCLFGNSGLAAIAVESEISWVQEVFGGELSNSVGPVPTNLNELFATANAIYQFETVVETDKFYELKSKTRIEVEIDGRGTDLGWNRVTASANGTSQLIDTAIVEGVEGQIGGLVEFLWGTSGASTITMDRASPFDGYFIEELFTTAFFNTLDENALPELIVNNQSQQVGPPNLESIVPGFFEPQVIVVDWLVGEELDLFFELATSSRLSVMNLDAAGFNSVVESDFSNTATLSQIRILDMDGNVIPGATLTSADGHDYASFIVPEPLSGVLAFWLLAMLAGLRTSYWTVSSKTT